MILETSCGFDNGFMGSIRAHDSPESSRESGERMQPTAQAVGT